MITQLKGKLLEKNPTHVVIDCNGVGYLVHISLHTFGKIPDQEELVLYTHLQVKEDSHSLYGFADRGEREVFRLLLSVSGIGSNTARTMLSSLEPDQIKDAIVQEDAALIQSVKGIGLKTAQRVILDLKDKMIKIYGTQEGSSAADNRIRNEALLALETLGFPSKQADKVVQQVAKAFPTITVEGLIKESLKKL